MRSSDDTEIEFFIGAWSIGVVEVFQNLLEYVQFFYGGIFFAIIESVGIVFILSVGVSAYKRLWEPKMYPTHNIVYRMNCFI